MSPHHKQIAAFDEPLKSFLGNLLECERLLSKLKVAARKHLVSRRLSAVAIFDPTIANHPDTTTTLEGA